MADFFKVYRLHASHDAELADAVAFTNGRFPRSVHGHAPDVVVAGIAVVDNADSVGLEDAQRLNAELLGATCAS